MTGHILGRAYEPGLGVCYVEHIGGDHFRLTPINSPQNRKITHRSLIRWMRAKKKETA